MRRTAIFVRSAHDVTVETLRSARPLSYVLKEINLVSLRFIFVLYQVCPFDLTLIMPSSSLWLCVKTTIRRLKVVISPIRSFRKILKDVIGEFSFADEVTV